MESLATHTSSKNNQLFTVNFLKVDKFLSIFLEGLLIKGRHDIFNEANVDWIFEEAVSLNAV